MFAQTYSNCLLNGQPVDCDTVLAPFMAMFGGLLGFFIGGVGIIIYLAVLVINIVANWKIYQKAGQPGWTSIIPIYNMIVLMDIVNKPRWWVILMFVPIVNIVVCIIAVHRLSLSFGKDIAYTLGLILLGLIFFPILGFGKSQYTKLA